MAPLKRKRPHDEAEAPEQATVTRRATRQTSIAPLPVQPDPEPRRRRPRAHPVDKPSEPDRTPREPPRALNGITHHHQHRAGRIMHRELALTPQPDVVPKQKATRTTRHSAGSNEGARPGPSLHDHHDEIENKRPAFAPAPLPLPLPLPLSLPRPAPRPVGRPPKQPLVSPQKTIGTSKPLTISTSAPSPQPQHQGAPTPEKPSSSSDRNIDKVVLGNKCFRAWYPSYYGKEVLGDISGNSTKGQHNANAGNANGAGGSKDDGGAKSLPRRERDNPPILDRLYVCPCCFKYSKELVMWWEHVRVCERSGYVPGEKIYVHPKGRRTVLVPPGPPARGPKKKKGEPNAKMTQKVMQDEGEWSIWEVDGEKDVLFCQNLSLFAKLFLDNKSVFFDVTGFNYFLLVYTKSSPGAPLAGDAAKIDPPRHNIVGFFSKEKMSWDNNNLACILIFPPWQRKGLGALLMGVSYEISKREGLLGGPEKPISDLGKKGYKRFWAGEIARWLVGLDLGEDEKEVIVNVEDCSKATWIAQDDCLGVLRDMGLAQDAGTGPPKGQDPKTPVEDAPEQPPEEPKLVPRVKISQAAVREWVKANNLSLEPACDPDGFVGGYAAKPVEVVEDV